MKKRLLRVVKWFFGIILGLILLISGGLYFFKDEITGIFVDEINHHLKAKVAVSEIDIAFWGSFPNLSVDFNNVFIRDSYVGATEYDTLLFSDRIRMKFNPMDLLSENYTVKSIDVSPGTLQLKVNEEGVNNYDILKAKEDSLESEGFDLNLESINFNDFRVSYSNKATDQSYRTHVKTMTLNGALSSSVFSTQASSDLKIIEARSGNVNLIRNQPARLDITVKVNQDSGIVEIPPSTIYVSNLPFSFEGKVDTLGYDFNVQGKNIAIADAANNFALQQSTTVKQFKGSGQLLFDLQINGKNKATTPAIVECTFGIAQGLLVDPATKIRLKSLKLDGKYSNKGGKDKEFLALNNISFVSTGGPFKGNVKLTHFDTPTFTGNANGLIDLSIIHSLFNIPSIESIGGNLDIRSDFKVTSHPNESQEMEYHIDKCEGDLQLQNIYAQFKDDKRLFEQLNGHLYLRNNEAGIDNVSLKLNKSDLLLNGAFRDIVSYFKGQGKLNVDVHIDSKYIAIADLGSEAKADKVEQPKRYMLPKDIDGKVYLDIGRMDYEGHSFNALKGNMTIHDRILHFPKISVNNGGADVRGSITIEERSPEYFYLTSQLVSKNIEFRSLFKEWNNFRQDVIKSNNIEGTAQANVSFEAPFELRGGIISKGIKATIGLQIDNGRLKNVSTFETITKSLKSSSARVLIGKDNINALEKKLLDLRFERLTNTLLIKNGVLTIPTMSIESSALDIEASGKHTFDNQIDYRFGFRYRDLKQKETSEFGEIIDDGLGNHIFMRMYGDLNNPTIEWDKQSRKEHSKQQREEAKRDAKAILKSEFGLFKNDTTVHEYIEDKTPKEELILDFDPVERIDDVHEEKKPEKTGRFHQKLRKWKQEAEEEKAEEFVIDD